MAEEIKEEVKEEKEVSSGIPAGETREPGEKTENKINPLNILCYFGILLIIPWMMAKDDEFVKFHVKQGLTLLIAEIITAIIGVIPVIGWTISTIAWIVWLVLSIMGIINVLKGEEKPLPLIGKFAENWKI